VITAEHGYSGNNVDYNKDRQAIYGAKKIQPVTVLHRISDSPVPKSPRPESSGHKTGIGRPLGSTKVNIESVNLKKGVGIHGEKNVTIYDVETNTVKEYASHIECIKDLAISKHTLCAKLKDNTLFSLRFIAWERGRRMTSEDIKRSIETYNETRRKGRRLIPSENVSI
jgi:hypothetical protein